MKIKAQNPIKLPWPVYLGLFGFFCLLFRYFKFSPSLSFCLFPSLHPTLSLFVYRHNQSSPVVVFCTFNVGLTLAPLEITVFKGYMCHFKRGHQTLSGQLQLIFFFVDYSYNTGHLKLINSYTYNFYAAHCNVSILLCQFLMREAYNKWH